MCKKYKRFRHYTFSVKVIVTVLSLSLSLGGCTISDIVHIREKETSESSKLSGDDIDFKVIESTIRTLSQSQNSSEFISNCEKNFSNSTLEDYLSNKSKNEIELCRDILQNVDLKSYSENTLVFSTFSTNSIFTCMEKDYNGFVKDYNNLISLGLNDTEINNYVLDYLIRVLENSTILELQKEDIECSVDVTNEKLSSDLFLTKLFDSYLTGLISKIRNTTFTIEEPAIKNKIKNSNFKIGKSKVMQYPLYEGDVTAEQSTEVPKEDAIGDTSNDAQEKRTKALLKILVNVNELLKNQEAYEKVCEINPMNASLNVNYVENNMYYVHYTITNFSGSDMTYNNCFYLIDSNYNLYSLNQGEYFGLQQSKVIKNGETCELDVVLIGPKETTLGWYDETNNYFYKLEGGE